ncbi:sigma-70 family RNA polymerase sigma factor [Pedobacter sp. B4-66]|uniref:RNA polymerase sigma factor n=1 Tax=Pedobacter sp. B4-66 TaxID=2817280 RepID=UPI001BDA5CCB|nr:sigma-70 family RNA polymerase sigma factor [Pedobacter sp. B4-66]
MRIIDDRDLIVRLQVDDMDAFNALYWKYQLKLYANIFKLLKDKNATEDVLQEVFITLWEKRLTVDPDNQIGGWLFTISYNKAINYLKKSLKESLIFEELNEELQFSGESAIVYRDVQLELIEKAVVQLSPQKRKVFDLCKIQGKTYEETAKELNISKHTVKEYLSGAVTNVKEYVNFHSQASTPFFYLVCLYQFFH